MTHFGCITEEALCKKGDKNMITAESAWTITKKNARDLETANKFINEIDQMIRDVCVEKDNLYYECDASENIIFLIDKKLQEYGYKTTLCKGWDNTILGITISWKDCE